MVPILCWSASDFAPLLTNLANTTGQAAIIPAGQQLAWWGMDIAEIRWMVVKAFELNVFAIAACVGFAVLAVFYFKWMKKEEAALTPDESIA